jgi:hypothetical protein
MSDSVFGLAGDYCGDVWLDAWLTTQQESHRPSARRRT